MCAVECTKQKMDEETKQHIVAKLQELNSKLDVTDVNYRKIPIYFGKESEDWVGFVYISKSYSSLITLDQFCLQVNTIDDPDHTESLVTDKKIVSFRILASNDTEESDFIKGTVS